MDARLHRWLVVGYGNELRGDDGAGPAAADRVRALGLPGVEVLACHQLLPEHSEALARADDVVFLDALADPGATLSCRPVEAAPSPEWTGHLGSPAALLSLTEQLHGHCPKACIIGLPAERFGWEIGLSARARAGVDAAVEQLRLGVWAGSLSGDTPAGGLPWGTMEAMSCTRPD